MIIHFNGAAKTVTGSQYLLEVNGASLLMECGLFQGKRDETYQSNLNFQFNPKKDIDAVLLSHAHLDHSGNLPNLVKKGYAKNIYATPATCKLAGIMLLDSGHIQEADIEFVNKRHSRRGEASVEPLYTIEDAEKAVKLFIPKEYEESFEPVPGVTVHFREAGHILGSASIVLDVNENGRKYRLWFSGDIGRFELPLMRDPVLPQDADFLMMECTYGDKIHGSIDDAYREFEQIVLETYNRGGKIIIPSFAVGRTQEIVFMLNRMVTAGVIPHIPVYVDSPLAVHATEIFRSFPQYFDEETNQFIQEGHHPALNFDGLIYTNSVDESKAINDRKGPLVIISASGMAESGRILHHLRNNIEDPKNTILIVSWQSPYTLGRQLADRAEKIKIFGEPYIRRAQVATIGGLSAHGDQEMLLRYAKSSQERLQKLILVHGEERSEQPFFAKLKEAGFKDIAYPKQNEIIEI